MAVESPYREDPWQHIVKVGRRFVRVFGVAATIGPITGMIPDFETFGDSERGIFQVFDISPAPATIKVVGASIATEPESAIEFSVFDYIGTTPLESFLIVHPGTVPSEDLIAVIGANLRGGAGGGTESRITFTANGAVTSRFAADLGFESFDPPL
jgi:hypothetical protein